MTNDVVPVSTVEEVVLLPPAVSLDPLSQTVQTYLSNFLSERTREAYEGDFKDFGAFITKTFGPISHPKDITKTHVISYRDYLREKYSPTSINRKMSALSSLFRELQGARLLDINPVEGVKRPQSIPKRPRLGFSDDEVNRILDSFDATTIQGLSTKAVLSFLLYTGCRISEVLAVRVSDIEDRGNLKVVIIRGKGDKIRTLPLHPKLLKNLTELIQRREKQASDYLFTRVKGEGSEDEPMRRQSVGELGALTGNQAVQQVQAGLKAIYLSGWQVAADANMALQTYPDQSLYPSDSVPNVVRRINNAFQRADQIQASEKKGSVSWFAPIVADAEAGLGGNLNAFELMKMMIEAGAAGVHFEDQLSSAKKCGHMGGKVLVPTQEAVQKLVAARLAADLMDVPTVLIARTDANGAQLITNDVDSRDREFLTGDRTVEGFFTIRGGIKTAIARGLAYAPVADLIWCETSEPNLAEARTFAEGVHSKFPGKLLAYNCSPSFNWKKKLDDATIARFRTELAAMGYKFQFITLAGFHQLNFGMFELATQYAERGMSAYAEFQAREFSAESKGYQATAHQRFVGTGYFDAVAQVIGGDNLSTRALKGSTEEEQFGH